MTKSVVVAAYIIVVFILSGGKPTEAQTFTTPATPRTSLIAKPKDSWTARYNREEDQDLGLWPQSIFDHRHGKWLFEFDVNPRLQYRITRLNELHLRSFVGYKLRPWVSLWLGAYPYVPMFEPQYVNEQRTLQQVALEHARGRLAYSLRTRLEQRYIENIDQASVRIRTMPRINYFIDEKESMYLFSADELFVNLNTVSTGIRTGLAQNRFYAGCGFALSKHQRLEGSYLNQWLHRRYHVSSLPNRMNHNIVLNMVTNF